LIHSADWVNFVGSGGVGKKARNMRSKSCVTKLFVAVDSWGVEEVVRICWVTCGGSVATGCAMVEGGGLVIDPRRLA